MQQDVVLLPGKVSEEEPQLQGLPPPGPQGLEGYDEEGPTGREKLQSSRTDKCTRCNVSEERVSVPVLPGEGWREMLPSCSRIKDLAGLR